MLTSSLPFTTALRNAAPRDTVAINCAAPRNTVALDWETSTLCIVQLSLINVQSWWPAFSNAARNEVPQNLLLLASDAWWHRERRAH